MLYSRRELGARLRLPPPMVVAESWLSDSKWMTQGATQHHGTLLVEGKSTSVFIVADGRKVKGHGLVHRPDWPWRESPWEPQGRYARLTATSPTYGGGYGGHRRPTGAGLL